MFAKIPQLDTVAGMMEKCANPRRLINQNIIIHPMKDCWPMKYMLAKMMTRMRLSTGMTTLNWK